MLRRIAAVFSREKRAQIVVEQFEAVSQEGIQALQSGDNRAIKAWLDRYRKSLGLVEDYRDTRAVQEFSKDKKMFSPDGKDTGRTLHDRLYGQQKT